MIATTHYDALKSYASTTEGVMAAGFGFDPQTFAPTYRLNYGSPGQQSRARDCQPPRHAGRRDRAGAGASHRARVAAGRTSGEDRARPAGARPRASAGGAGTRDASQERQPGCSTASRSCRHREETFRRKLDERIEERLREARREIDGVVDRAENAHRGAGRGRRAAHGAAAGADGRHGRSAGRSACGG